MNVRKYLVLLLVTLFAGTGDILLKVGMNQLKPIRFSHLVPDLFAALGNPWVVIGILCLIAFFASYLTALSWADLSYVLPATALGYVLITLLSKFLLHETVSVYRWAGVLLISCGVGWVTRGPALTEHQRDGTKLDGQPLRNRQEQHELA
ncbi:MAG TPA: DMT family transporter [Candidatus Angelobacter sp.]|nr:DMT family transporter [Candidatus Angelobacter sp.]